MKKYIAREIDVEAIQFDGTHSMMVQIKELFKDSARIDDRYDYGKSRIRLIILDRMTNRYFEANAGDYIVRGALGELFVYRENLFNAMFRNGEVDLEVEND